MDQLLAPGSFFRRIPVNLDDRQKHLIDGVGMAARVVEIHWDRLRTEALAVDDLLDDVRRIRLVSMYADAWGMVDHMARIRKFVAALDPKRQSEAIVAFLAATEGLTGLRNTIQHLHNLAPNISPSEPILGTLSWIEAAEPGGVDYKLRIATVGADRPLVGETGYDIVAMAVDTSEPIDHVILTGWEPSFGEARKHRTPPGLVPGPNRIGVSLSQSWVALKALIRELESVLGGQHSNEPASGNGGVLTIDVRLDRPPPKAAHGALSPPIRASLSDTDG